MQPIPTVQTAIGQTVYFTINHNLPVIIYVFGAISMIALLVYKPQRRIIAFMMGFILLTLHFEYVKHIAEPLLKQTEVSIGATGYQSVKGSRLMDIVITNLAPLGLLLGGWFFIFIGILLSTLTRKEKKSASTQLSE